ncbi:interleukin-1 receptor type 1-like [Tiliqua scincoides]|uniref:interleukin-1 receptor type 1-like n=1 Tax=Tiliqua scincoides TaxID=71010 RepID=UPI0034634088
MIKDERFQRLKDYILINNTTMEDQGSYTCKMPYYDTGKKYSISRDIRLMVTGNNLLYMCERKEVLLDRQPFCTVRLNILEVSKREYEHPLVCHALNHFGHVTAYVKLKDKVPDFRRPLIGLLLTTLVFGTVIVWICKVFKVNIVLWYRNSGCPLISKVVSDGKIYDAYVLSLKANGKGHVYCLDNFVLKILPDVLERQCGYNLFIVGRDDLPGQAVIHIADDTIKHSRRLIIILEPELSSCSRLEETSEQQIAIYNALVCYGIKVILIEMGKLQDYTNMPESIQYIKQKHGAIRWKKDFAEKSLSADTTFWKNVRYQMPPRRSASHSEFHLLPQISTNSATTISR